MGKVKRVDFDWYKRKKHFIRKTLSTWIQDHLLTNSDFEIGDLHKINIAYAKQIALESHLAIDLKSYFGGLQISDLNSIQKPLKSCFFVALKSF